MFEVVKVQAKDLLLPAGRVRSHEVKVIIQRLIIDVVIQAGSAATATDIDSFPWTWK